MLEDKENKKERKPKATAKTTYDRNDPKNYCAHCDGFWEDDEEPEDWWQCITCEDSGSMSLAQDYLVAQMNCKLMCAVIARNNLIQV